MRAVAFRILAVITDYPRPITRILGTGDVSAADHTEGIEALRAEGTGRLSRSTRRLLEALFDVPFYLRTYPDVRDSGVDPIRHYLDRGWREGRDPSSTFSTVGYLDQNPDVRAAGLCPLFHYVSWGITEGRVPRPAAVQTARQSSLELARQVINSAASSRDRVKPWQVPQPLQPLEPAALKEALAACATDKHVGIVFVLSHDDYASIPGGVQNVIAAEERAFIDKGWAYLHICPAQPLPVLADPMPESDAFVWLRLNGQRLGAVTVLELAQALNGAVFGDGRRLMVLHHLMGFAPEHVARIADVFTPDETIAWIHDFFTLCPSYALLRNNVVFCGGPSPESQACTICAYGGAERKRHVERVRRLFERLKPTVMAPSVTALRFWTRRGQLSCRNARAAPLGALAMDSVSPPARRHQEGHLRVGFVGFPMYHKGWHVFQQLARQHDGDTRYAFFHLGSTRAPEYVNTAFVDVTMDRKQDFMVDAVADNEIDVVVNWSLCYETFSFTAHEAIAGGAFVLAPIAAGNIVPAITQAEQGLGLESEQELFDLFASGDVLELAQHRRRGMFIRRPGTAYYIETAS
jgi:hypothetical protein